MTWRQILVVVLTVGTVDSAVAGPVFFSTGDPDGLIATASRPSGNGKIEIESADDFVLASRTSISSATFTGLLTGAASPADIAQVRVEIYRVFPKDSAFPPSGNVPTRNNSPSDVAFADRDTAAKNLSFSTNVLNSSFTTANSVLNGINKVPNQFTGGEGAVTGKEVLFNVSFTTPFVLPADHYFFVPQVLLATASDEFMWLSAPKPIVAPGTPFLPDLQSWIRNEDLAPDWLRVGTDITHQGPFNAAFSLNGTETPEPSSLILIATGVIGLFLIRLCRLGAHR
jgi:hypothetical protein